jgi:lipopolysaccharide biosynthesis regulator YciM
MAQKKNSFCVEISDIFDEEQEDFVIEKVASFVKQNREELKEHFQTTDTIDVRRLTEEDAKKLCAELEGKDLSLKMSDIQQKKQEKEENQIRCPKCKTALETLDWRCPECYYEFPEYEFVGDDDEDEL